ncbi:MAG: translation initiation factor eIF-1A [Candidatus Micrarchaeota archaeon]|nr:translation initiation factor eIF-1A [Candidatus Micrarchaeota archaeon]MDE1833950.1 translation initiation factor eIF-1A [Candidatus Micrarchaeota archaeon]MDE1859826.1 translation initiation factor eIF-1A [Candidatus Micrarchaeota archaeon]
MFRKPGQPPEEHRLILPKEGELIGVVVKAQGASKFSVLCSDNRERMCSIPGRLKRRFWIKENDLVLVKPWVVQGDEKGDVVYRYSLMDKDSLKQRGFTVPQV